MTYQIIFKGNKITAYIDCHRDLAQAESIAREYSQLPPHIGGSIFIYKRGTGCTSEEYHTPLKEIKCK